jgi:predicted NBD/HSP70 family sugar kinase
MAPVPVLIQSNSGIVTVQGAADGTPVSIYTTAGTQAGSAVSQNGRAAINTNLQPGTIAIIKIGTQSFKVVIK